MKHVFVITGTILCLASVVQSAEQEFTLKASADTYVDGDNPSINYGTVDTLAVYADWEGHIYTKSKEILVKFDIPDTLYGLDQAILRLHVVGAGNDTGKLEISQPDSEWLEEEVTLFNSPDFNRHELCEGVPPAQGLFEVDVTNIVRTWIYDGMANYGFYIEVPDIGEEILVTFASREHLDPDLHPELFVYYSGCNDCNENQVFEDVLTVTTVSSGKVKISYNLSHTQSAALTIYDISGSVVRTIQPESGTHSVEFESAPGVYFARLVGGSEVVTRKFVSVR